MKKYNSLLQIAPNLVKEWHPTANGNLNPRSLEVVYPRKVWWICSEGHEWKDKIKNRINQNDCPTCKKIESTKKADKTSNIPIIGKNRRKYNRFKTSAIAVVIIPKSGHMAYSEIKNFSRKGLCLEADTVIRPGSAITLKFNKNQVMSKPSNTRKSVNTDDFKTYNSTVKWFRILENERSASIANIGIEL